MEQPQRKLTSTAQPPQVHMSAKVRSERYFTNAARCLNVSYGAAAISIDRVHRPIVLCRFPCPEEPNRSLAAALDHTFGFEVELHCLQPPSGLLAARKQFL